MNEADRQDELIATLLTARNFQLDAKKAMEKAYEALRGHHRALSVPLEQSNGIIDAMLATGLRIKVTRND